MRRFFPFLLVLVISLSAQSQNCSAPVSSLVFQQKVNQITALRQDQQRIRVATEFATKNCLLTYQVKQLTELFNDDATRLLFVQDAFPTIFDKENIYDLYDGFAYFSTAMRFHDYLELQSQRPPRPGRNNEMTEQPFSFPEYNYPSYESYHDASPCSQPLNDKEFFRVVRNVMSLRDDESRVVAAIQLAESNCLTVAQIMKMGSLIEKEAKRLDYLKRTYDYTYDVGNFHYSNQLFKDKAYTSDFDNFVRTRRGRPDRDNRNNNGRREPLCGVSDNEFQEIVATIKAQSFENTQVTMAKQIVRTKQCFTTLQIKQLLEVFTFENTKLDMAKYCFGYCVDRGDYYKINSVFTFSSSVEDLTNFISSQQ